jgi:subtilisin family serine protease
LDRIDHLTGTDTSYQYRYTGANDIVVYVVDTGIRKTHEDFYNVDGVSRVQDQCFSAFEGVGCHNDTLGHGTHVGML